MKKSILNSDEKEKKTFKLWLINLFNCIKKNNFTFTDTNLVKEHVVQSL